MYDVMVIGAGPAGCTAAKTLSEKGYRVLLVEKFKLPRYKSCSGILIKKTMDLVKLYFGEDTPSFTMCTPTQNQGMIFTNDKGEEFRFEQPGLNVWRGSFDYWLSVKAVQSGTEVRDYTAAISCQEKGDCVSVTLHGETVYTEQAKYVIDCEGVVGSVKRKMLKAAPSYITTFQTFNSGNIDLDPHYFYAYLQPELSEYDAWFNVKDGQLVLGVSVKEPANIKMYYERFIAYMQSKHQLVIQKQISAEKWLMPRVRPERRIEFGIGRILFAGEAAGFLNPMGEGISAGMESGYHAANAVADHFNNMDIVYAVYKCSTLRLRAYMERQWRFVAAMADTFSEMK
ncbi:MAG: NAD(P)/FAD-dependent oxidoreductase [Clostridiales bacterium]|nr:NAD(P)/FAD-dependent oxidoreductase [Clostridiales bacterium]